MAIADFSGRLDPAAHLLRVLHGRLLPLHLAHVEARAGNLQARRPPAMVQ